MKFRRILDNLLAIPKIATIFLNAKLLLLIFLLQIIEYDIFLADAKVYFISKCLIIISFNMFTNKIVPVAFQNSRNTSISYLDGALVGV